MATSIMAIVLAATALVTQDGTAMRPGTFLDVIITQTTAELDASERAQFDDVTVLARGEDNRTVGCGIYDAHLAVKGQLVSGDTAYFYVPWCFPTKAAPSPGDLCRFDVRLDTRRPSGRILGEHDIPEEWDNSFKRRYNLVEEFHCPPPGATHAAPAP